MALLKCIFQLLCLFMNVYMYMYIFVYRCTCMWKHKLNIESHVPLLFPLFGNGLTVFQSNIELAKASLFSTCLYLLKLKLKWTTTPTWRLCSFPCSQKIGAHTCMVWNSPLYGLNMYYCDWLIKKLLSANGSTEYSQDGKDI